MCDVMTSLFADPTVHALGMALAIGGIAIWLAASWWAFNDGSRRSDDGLVPWLAAAWIIISTPLLLPLSLAIWSLGRPQVSAADSRAGQLAQALTAVATPRCPGCERRVDPAWRRCPSCEGWLAAPCTSCAAWSDRTLAACPFCGTDGHDQPEESRAPLPASAALPLVGVRSPG